MIVKCPCGQKLTPKNPANIAAGTRLRMRCTCGDYVQFRVPEKPKPNADTFYEMLRRAGYPIGAGFP